MRTYIGQDGLGDLALLCIEQINFDQVFDQLTAINSEKSGLGEKLPLGAHTCLCL